MSDQLRHPMARARGLGPAKSGLQHWWQQRLTAVALIVLVLAMMGFILSLVGADYQTAVATLGSPLPGTIALLLVIAGFWHLKLGAQVVIQDYIHHEGIKLAAIIALTFACVAVGLLSALAVLSLIIGA